MPKVKYSPMVLSILLQCRHEPARNLVVDLHHASLNMHTLTRTGLAQIHDAVNDQH